MRKRSVAAAPMSGVSPIRSSAPVAVRRAPWCGVAIVRSGPPDASSVAEALARREAAS